MTASACNYCGDFRLLFEVPAHGGGCVSICRDCRDDERAEMHPQAEAANA